MGFEIRPLMDFDDWMAYGITQGWCGPPVCATHDGVPCSDEEAENDEPCLHVVRMYDSPETKSAVEADHSPSQWRNTYTKEIKNG